MTSLVLFRHDLRIDDHPALAHGAKQGPVLPVFLSDPREDRGAAYQWWLRQSLRSLTQGLADLGLPLICRRGHSEEILPQLIQESGATQVYWNRRYAQAERERDQQLKTRLRQQGMVAESFPGDLLTEPWTLLRENQPFKVFTPFWKKFLQSIEPAQPCSLPQQWLAAPRLPASENPDDWHWEPRNPDWASPLLAYWQPGEPGAHQRWREFLDHRLRDYAKGRDFPALEKVSRLSPHLAHGEISPRRLWQMARERAAAKPGLRPAVDKFLQELGWREFSWHLLYHFPQLPTEPLRAEFRHFPWQEDRTSLQAWARGRTGYPMVDAGMRELWQTGYLHNRVRMIAASFLVKDLLLPWQWGAAWFWDTLLDADPANNNASWQWVAGCGTDAAPYFRIFNPSLQAAKFDPEGHYQRRWVPELAALPNSALPSPWAYPETLESLGIQLGRDYPLPIIDHAVARERALSAFQRISVRTGDHNL